MTALLDPATLKWKDLVTPGTPLPTPWPKEEFETLHEGRSRSGAAQIRAANRPEAEMDALFREEDGARHGAARTKARTRARSARSKAPTTRRSGYYRPQADCIMFTRDNVPFCAVCRRAIEQILDLYAR